MSKTAVTIFDNEKFGKVRGLMIDGVPYFVGKDVADALEYVNSQKAIRDHVDEEDKTVTDSFTVHGTSPVLINESGLYSLILSSKLPKAKEFRHWVTSEVLPAIRQTGGYVSTNTIKTDFVRFVETVTRLDPSVHKTVVDAFLGMVNTPDMSQKKRRTCLRRNQTYSHGSFNQDYFCQATHRRLPYPRRYNSNTAFRRIRQ